MTKINTKELRKDVNRLSKLSNDYDDALNDFCIQFDKVDRDIQKMLESIFSYNELAELLYKGKMNSLFTKIQNAKNDLDCFKHMISWLYEDLDKLESKNRDSAKVHLIKKGFKTFFINFTGATSLLGVPTSFVMLLIAESHGSMYTGLIWFLVAAICLATFFIILDKSDC